MLVRWLGEKNADVNACKGSHYRFSNLSLSLFFRNSWWIFKNIKYSKSLFYIKNWKCILPCVHDCPYFILSVHASSVLLRYCVRDYKSTCKFVDVKKWLNKDQMRRTTWWLLIAVIIFAYEYFLPKYGIGLKNIFFHTFLRDINEDLFLY